MGLSIVRTIVEAHNGRITAENQLGGGAVFGSGCRLPSRLSDSGICGFGLRG